MVNLVVFVLISMDLWMCLLEVGGHHMLFVFLIHGRVINCCKLLVMINKDRKERERERERERMHINLVWTFDHLDVDGLSIRFQFHFIWIDDKQINARKKKEMWSNNNINDIQMKGKYNHTHNSSSAIRKITSTVERRMWINDNSFNKSWDGMFVVVLLDVAAVVAVVQWFSMAQLENDAEGCVDWYEWNSIDAQQDHHTWLKFVQSFFLLQCSIDWSIDIDHHVLDILYLWWYIWYWRMEILWPHHDEGQDFEGY